jgi:hypothetical protein
MFEHLASIESDVPHAGSVGGIGVAGASIVRTDGLINVAAEAVQ